MVIRSVLAPVVCYVKGHRIWASVLQSQNGSTAHAHNGIVSRAMAACRLKQDAQNLLLGHMLRPVRDCKTGLRHRLFQGCQDSRDGLIPKGRAKMIGSRQRMLKQVA